MVIDLLHLVQKYNFGHYVCTHRKWLPATCEGLSLGLSVLIVLIFFFSDHVRISRKPIAVDSGLPLFDAHIWHRRVVGELMNS